MNKCHLDHKVATELGHDFFRVHNDVYGNPRYVIHFLAFASDYDKASLIQGQRLWGWVCKTDLQPRERC